MTRQRFNKLFSAEEANRLIPKLEILIRELQINARALRDKFRELARVDDRVRRLDLGQALEHHPELRPYAEKMSAVAVEIESMGCLLKDIDMGLVDFPFRPDGIGAGEDEVGFMCWQSGEPHLVAWHPIDGGFAGRKRLPGTSKPYLN